MTDKEKIKAEIKKRIVFQKECIKNSYRLTGKPEEEIILEYKQLLSFIDSLPEEPVSIWHDASEKPERENLLIETNDGRIIHRQSINNYGMVKRWAYISVLLNLDNSCNFGKKSQEKTVSIDFEQELYKAFGQVKDFTLGMRIAKWFYDMGKNSQEPVSEDLEEAAKVYEQTRNDLDVVSDNQIVERAFKAGAKWQKQQDQSTIELAEDHAMLAGMEKMKEQMMKDAVDGVVEYKYSRSGKNLFDVGSRVLLDAAKYHVDDGGKVKLIIVKED